MEQYVTQIAKHTTTALTLVALSLVFVEWGILTIQHKVKRHKEGWVSVASAGLAFLPIFLLIRVALLGGMFWLYQHRVMEMGFRWYHWLIAWIIYDFLFWFIHMLGHKVRLFWCLHNVHHTSKEMKLSAAFRGSFLDVLLIQHKYGTKPANGSKGIA